MDRAGRRDLLMYSSGGMFLSCVFLTASLYGLLPKVGALAAVSAFVSFFEIGLGPIPWLIVAEMFEGQQLDLAQSVACQVNWLCNFLVGLLQGWTRVSCSRLSREAPVISGVSRCPTSENSHSEFWTSDHLSRSSRRVDPFLDIFHR